MERPDREEFSSCRTGSAATGAHGQDRFFMPAVERPRAFWGGSVGVLPDPYPTAGDGSGAGPRSTSDPKCCPRSLLSPALEALWRHAAGHVAGTFQP
jgi:hypothetical protein